MRDENEIVRERQRFIRRQMEVRGILLKQVQLDGGWDSVSTVASYFPADEHKEPATMSVAALYRLIKSRALPAELLSLLLPDGFVIVQVPECVDYDEVSSVCREFIDEKEKAHHPESEAGRDIGPTEDAELGYKVVKLWAAKAA